MCFLQGNCNRKRNIPFPRTLQDVSVYEDPPRSRFQPWILDSSDEYSEKFSLFEPAEKSSRNTGSKRRESKAGILPRPAPSCLIYTALRYSYPTYSKTHLRTRSYTVPFSLHTSLSKNMTSTRWHHAKDQNEQRENIEKRKLFGTARTGWFQPLRIFRFFIDYR